jgi:hypothetical protein
MLVNSCHLIDKSDLSKTAGLNNSIQINKTFIDSIQNKIKLRSDRYFSSYTTPIEAQYMTNGIVTDSIIQSSFNMISWYGANKDSIYLVAHIDEMETSALLLRFVKGQTTVWYLRAGHSLHKKYFKINKSDSFANEVMVPPLRYKLRLSEIPDTLNKQIVFGQIDMNSADYYDNRDTLQNKYSIKMKFYFRSQYKKIVY